MTVYLVGAGPGDPGLLTVKGRDALAGADVVLYDGLVDGRILEVARPGVLLIDVAKTRPGAHSRGYGPAQREIDDLLIAHGRSGARVVRLKGGDAFVFGRGGEEALALAAAGVPFEVIPGVSSAIAVPAYAGIPVTHRGLAASATIVTGHETPDKPQGAAGVDWNRLATAADTLIVLMGITRLPTLVQRLQDGGRPPDTPAAIVEQGTTPRQRVISGTLGELPALASGAGVRSPAVIVVGEVVRLHERLAWFDPGRGEPALGVLPEREQVPHEAPACA